jgi:ribosome assembly protein YihI (activator of Der GTPase)
MWKRSGKRTGANHKIGGEENQQGGSKAESKDCGTGAQHPVRAGMSKVNVENEERYQEADKSV